MNKFGKIGMGVGATSLLALALAIPVFKDVQVDTLRVAEAKVASAYVADDVAVEDIVTEEDTEDTENPAAEEKGQDQAEGEADSTPDNCAEFVYKNPTPGEELVIEEEWMVEEECYDVDLNKYDEDLRVLAEEYLAKGYYLSDCEYDVNCLLSGIGYRVEDEDGKGGTDYLFTDGFNVVDDNTGNNTFYIEVVKVTPEQFELFMGENSGGVWFKTEEGSEVTYTTSDGYNNMTIKYNTETGIMTYINDFSEAQGKAVG